MVDRDRAGRAGAATVPGHPGALARSAMVSWVLRVATAAALGVDAVVHWQNAPAYDAVAAAVSQGALFRAEAAVAVAVGLLILVRPRTSGWVAAVLVAASALGAVVLYRYVDLGALGPLPDMYEDTWQVPGKPLSAWAEGAAVVLAGLGLLTHCKHPRRQRLFLRTAVPERRRLPASSRAASPIGRARRAGDRAPAPSRRCG